MAEAEPVQPFADRSAMHRNIMDSGHLGHDPVQRQVAPNRQPVAQPAVAGCQFALRMAALDLWQKPPALAFQNDHVIDETW